MNGGRGIADWKKRTETAKQIGSTSLFRIYVKINAKLTAIT